LRRKVRDILLVVVGVAVEKESFPRKRRFASVPD